MPVEKLERRECFVKTPTELLTNKNLTFIARVTLNYALSLPETWEVKRQFLSDAIGAAPRTLTLALQELYAAGYCSSPRFTKDLTFYAEPKRQDLKLQLTRPKENCIDEAKQAGGAAVRPTSHEVKTEPTSSRDIVLRMAYQARQAEKNKRSLNCERNAQFEL